MPAQMTQGGGLCRADGLVDPSGIPGVTMDPAMIRTAAWTLAAGGEGIAQHGDTASSKWQTLSAVYQAPESDALLAVMTPVAQKTTQVGHGFTTVATALNAFATAVEPIVEELKRLQTEAIAFVADAVQGYDLPAVGPQPVQHLTDYGMDSGPPEEMYSSPAKHVDWTGYPPYAMHNEKLIKAIEAQATALEQAQADCVNAIRAAANPSAPPEQVRGEDFTAEAAAGDHLPFGTTARGQHKGECFNNFLWGGLDATVANIQGMASLANFDLDKGRFYDWAHWGGTLAGTAEALGVLVVPTPLAWIYANDPGGMVPKEVRDSSQSVLDKQQQTVDGFLGSAEQWKTDPAGAWGALAANVAPMLIPVGGEAAAGAKVAATGAKVAAVGTRLGEAADAASVAGRVAGAAARASVAVGSGMVRVGDLLTTAMTKVDAVNRAATGAAVQALREAIDRIPTVEVVVTHAVTPDGFRIPVHAHVEFGSRNHTHAMAEAADRGAGHDGRAALASDRHAGASDASHEGELQGKPHTGHSDADFTPSDRLADSGRHADDGTLEHPRPAPAEAGAKTLAHPRPLDPSEYAKDDYWRSLSPEEIKELPVVRDGSHFRADRTLQPSTWYQTGEHEYLYRTNEHGHIDRVIIQDLQPKVHEGRLPHQRNPQGKLSGDDAGHLAADSAGGSPKLDNIIAMSSKNNRIEFRALERKLLARKIEFPDEQIWMDIRIDPDPMTGRAPSFDVEYQLNGQILSAEFHQ